MPLELHWKNGRAKLEVGLAKGKKQHDKRATEKDRDWQRDKARSCCAAEAASSPAPAHGMPRP